MTTDQLREVLAYPDDAAPIDLARVVHRAARIRRRRRALTAAVGVALAGAAVAGAGTLLGGAGHDVLVQTPSTGGTSGATVQQTPDTSIEPPAPITLTPSADVPEGPLVEGVHLSMGHGWAVWVQGDEVCRSAPGDTAMPVDCRSITDGNIGGLNVQSAGSATGVMLSGLLPYRAARLVVQQDGADLEATLHPIRGHGEWMFWSVWKDGDLTRGSVVAYDKAGVQIERMRL